MTERRDRTERLLNLVLCLLGTTRPVPRHDIEQSVEGYGSAASQAAFERMFERDKDDLRALGIPIETIYDVDGTVIGYKISREHYSDVQLELDPEQARLVSVVPLLWTEDWARAATLAQRKIEVHVSSATSSFPRDSVQGNLTPPPPGVDLIVSALTSPTRTLYFDYTSLAHGTAPRHVVPQRLRIQAGQWYLRAFDFGADEYRTFRVSRMYGMRLGDIAPDDIVNDSLEISLGDNALHLKVHVNPVGAAELRLHAREIEDHPDGHEILTIDSDPWTLRWLLLRAGMSASLDPEHLSSREFAPLIVQDAAAVAQAHGGDA